MAVPGQSPAVRWCIRDSAQPEGVWVVEAIQSGEHPNQTTVTRTWMLDGKPSQRPLVSSEARSNAWDAGEFLADAAGKAYKALAQERQDTGNEVGDREEAQKNMADAARHLRRLQLGLSVVRGNEAIETARQLLREGMASVEDSAAKTGSRSSVSSPAELFERIAVHPNRFSVNLLPDFHFDSNKPRPTKTGIPPIRAATLDRLDYEVRSGLTRAVERPELR